MQATRDSTTQRKTKQTQKLKKNQYLTSSLKILSPVQSTTIPHNDSTCNS